MNQRDRVGTLMAFMVWVLMVYSAITILLLAQNHHLAVTIASLYCTLVALALASHAKTTFTDPGSVPSSAVPIVTRGVKFHSMCSVCQTYKPKGKKFSRDWWSLQTPRLVVSLAHRIVFFFSTQKLHITAGYATAVLQEWIIIAHG
jgi:uncharacterized membrane protein